MIQQIVQEFLPFVGLYRISGVSVIASTVFPRWYRDHILKFLRVKSCIQTSLFNDLFDSGKLPDQQIALIIGKSLIIDLQSRCISTEERKKYVLPYGRVDSGWTKPNLFQCQQRQ